ncbi:MAG: ketopantoate reductase family protein [Anaerolineales bacterium]
MKVLIVGCGAVGQVYGLFLQKAGVELGLYDKPAVAEKLKRAKEHGGLPLFQVVGRRRDPAAHRLADFRVIADEEQARRFAPDQIWFAVPSPVYYTEWFRSFLRGVPSRRVVCFAPEGGRPEFIPPDGAERMVFGGTAFMAWQGGPEAGGGTAGGVNFWRTPLGIPLAGTKEACRDAGQVLKRAGFGYTVDGPDSRTQGCITAAMTAFTAGLELAGWSLQEFRRSPWLGRSAAACREAVLGQLPDAGGWHRALLGAAVLSAAFRLVAAALPMLTPFEIEAYLRFHYTKTRGQTLALLEMFAADGEAKGKGTGNIREVLRGLRAAGKDD